MENKIRVLIPEDQVAEKIKEIGAKISEDYAGKEVHLICVLKGGVFFTCELAKRITVPVSLDFMSVSSYGSGTQSSGVVKIVKDLDEPLAGKHVLIVEDIIDSGRTLSYLIEILKQRGPADIRICTLLDKPSRRVKKEVQVDYTCFSIPDEFVVGYGLDYDQKYRNLPYIGAVEIDIRIVNLQSQRNGLGFYLAVVVLMVLAFVWIRGSLFEEGGHPWQDFVEAVEDDRVASARITPNREVPAGTVTLIFNDGSSEKTWNVTDVGEVEDYLVEQGIPATMEHIPDDDMFFTPRDAHPGGNADRGHAGHDDDQPFHVRRNRTRR